jgi:DNA-binding NtrC family response regulator
VEDEDIVRKFAAKSLRKHGYVVEEAAIAEEALEIFNAADEDFDLLFTDSVLPDQPGIELVEQIRQINPDINILVTSGYTDQRSQWATVKKKGFNFLQKPYSLTDLYKMIRMVLDNG